jgi:hypothetical protein
MNKKFSFGVSFNFYRKNKGKKHIVEPHYLGFLCFSYTQPNTYYIKIPISPTCILIVFFYFSYFYMFFYLTFQKDALDLARSTAFVKGIAIQSSPSSP